MEKHLTPPTVPSGTKVIKSVTLWLAAILTTALLASCTVEVSDGYDTDPTYEVQIVSDLEADGDIALSPSDDYTVTSARDTGAVLAGIDPRHGDEFRGFLAFPLRGSQGVPLYADIESATLEIAISSVTERFPGDGVPLLIDLVSFSPPILIASDFDRGPLLSLSSYIIFADDAGFVLSFDVTSLMVEAQRRDLTHFQIRVMLDDAYAGSGLVEIEDNSLSTAPLLTVTYY